MGAGLGKDKLIYDATTPGEGDSVASYLRTSEGALHATEVAEDIWALDVNIAGGSITCNLDGIYVDDTNLLPDNVGIIGHTRAETPGAAQQVERTTVGLPGDGVVNNNVHGLDTIAFLMGYNGTTYDRLKATSGALHVRGDVADDDTDAGKPIKIGSRAISGLLGVVQTGDRADVISDLYRRIRTTSAPNISLAANTVSIPDTTATLICTSIAGRERVLVQNLGGKAMYVGGSAVATTTGVRIAAGANMEIPLGPSVDLYGISSSGALDVRFLQVA